MTPTSDFGSYSSDTEVTPVELALDRAVETRSRIWTEENPQFTLYTHDAGPNGWKVLMVLRELGLTYRSIYLQFGGSAPNGMKTTYYESINPNGRIPSLIDHSVPGIEDGNGLGIPVGGDLIDESGNIIEREEDRRGGLVIWESGAIVLYLVRKYDTQYKLWAKTLEEQSQIETWLFFQVSGQGPYLGQAMWFFHYHSEQLPSAIARYINETHRVLRIVNRWLSRPNNKGWLVLGRITVADIAFFHWYLHAKRVKIDIREEFPVVWDWIERMRSRESTLHCRYKT